MVRNIVTHVRRGTSGMKKTQSSRDRLEQSLARIADPKGEGARACLTVYAEEARAAASAADARAEHGLCSVRWTAHRRDQGSV